MPKMTDPCGNQPQPLLSLEEAKNQILAEIQPITGVFREVVEEGVGRVCAADVISPTNLPHDRNSAMDGYALSSQDLKPDQAFALSLVGTAWAGKPYPAKLKRGECIRIFTGAVIPPGADTVIMQEQVSADGERVQFPVGLEPFQNVREPGEDIKKGEILCPKGKIITPGDIGLLVAAGIAELPIYALPNVTYFSTGDELVSLGQALGPGQIYDSNSHVLHDLLSELPVDAVELESAPDDLRSLKNRIRRMATCNDLIISTGGASVGDADFIEKVVGKLGVVKVWKVAVKPGKPLLFGKIGDCYYFGLPGNPVSMMVTFQQVVVPAILKLIGANPARKLRLTATCTTPLEKKPGREEFQRGILTQDDSGELFVATTGNQGSHILSSMSKGNCFIVLPKDNAGCKAGEQVWVEPFDTYLSP